MNKNLYPSFCSDWMCVCVCSRKRKTHRQHLCKQLLRTFVSAWHNTFPLPVNIQSIISISSVLQSQSSVRTRWWYRHHTRTLFIVHHDSRLTACGSCRCFFRFLSSSTRLCTARLLQSASTSPSATSVNSKHTDI